MSCQRYAQLLEVGQRFERYVYRTLRRDGVTLTPCDTLKEQIQIGENREGLEIKLDRNFQKTGNLFIETVERPTDTSRWRPSGIWRRDNTRLYLIGDYDEWWVFDVVTLRSQHDAGVWREVAIPTAKGYLLPVREAGGLAKWTWERGLWDPGVSGLAARLGVASRSAPLGLFAR